MSNLQGRLYRIAKAAYGLLIFLDHNPVNHQMKQVVFSISVKAFK